MGVQQRMEAVVEAESLLGVVGMAQAVVCM